MRSLHLEVKKLWAEIIVPGHTHKLAQSRKIGSNKSQTTNPEIGSKFAQSQTTQMLGHWLDHRSTGRFVAPARLRSSQAQAGALSTMQLCGFSSPVVCPGFCGFLLVSGGFLVNFWWISGGFLVDFCRFPVVSGRTWHQVSAEVTCQRLCPLVNHFEPYPFVETAAFEVAWENA